MIGCLALLRQVVPLYLLRLIRLQPSDGNKGLSASSLIIVVATNVKTVQRRQNTNVNAGHANVPVRSKSNSLSITNMSIFLNQNLTLLIRHKTSVFCNIFARRACCCLRPLSPCSCSPVCVFARHPSFLLCNATMALFSRVV